MARLAPSPNLLTRLAWLARVVDRNRVIRTGAVQPGDSDAQHVGPAAAEEVAGVTGDGATEGGAVAAAAGGGLASVGRVDGHDGAIGRRDHHLRGALGGH